ncbi:hypothetical protein [Crocosphaera watsonii]|nr:hypothetical protein [Crocosphaera watsonii]
MLDEALFLIFFEDYSLVCDRYAIRLDYLSPYQLDKETDRT